MKPLTLDDDGLGHKLIMILSNHCGETGENEGAVETLNRIIEDAEKWGELPDEFCRVDLDDMLEYAEDRQIKLRLKKRIEELSSKNVDTMTWIEAKEGEALQKILGEKNDA